MIDQDTANLLRAVCDALTIPTPARAEDHPAHRDLAIDRTATVRRALAHAIATKETGPATDLIDMAALDSPVTYPTASGLWLADGTGQMGER